MARCVKCGHDPDRNSCPHCGFPDRNARVNSEGEAVYICCGKAVNPKLAAEPKPVERRNVK